MTTHNSLFFHFSIFVLGEVFGLCSLVSPPLKGEASHLVEWYIKSLVWGLVDSHSGLLRAGIYHVEVHYSSDSHHSSSYLRTDPSFPSEQTSLYFPSQKYEYDERQNPFHNPAGSLLGEKCYEFVSCRCF